ncbi:MAG: nucleoside kinase [Prevotellaceae bacterium]|jgi:uridine kinase|nr:nucleoside kinase [Prevotellaceae bacterium]
MQEKVKIICKNLNNQVFEFPLGTTLIEIYNALKINLPYQLMSAHVNNKSEDLNFQVFRHKTIEFLDVSTPSGFRVYLRSMSIVLAKAVSDLFPDDVLRIENSVCHGYYCTVNGRENKIAPEKIQKIKQKVQDIIKKDIPVIPHEEPTESVIELFRKQGDMDKVYILERLGKPFSKYFSIDNFFDHYSDVLVPSTGYLSLFDLLEYENGMFLMIPDRLKPNQLAKFENQPKLFDIFNEFSRWNTLLGFDNVGDFNRVNNKDTVFNMIKVAEALHEKKIAQIADMIVKNNSKIVLVSGPSSSGKTTFGKRLSIQLMTSGIKPVAVSMDNYFVDRKHTPLDENGNPDFESLYAVDLELFNKQLTQLLNGEKVKIPTFNFEDGKRCFRGDFLQLSENSVLIIEGIHALNPSITNGVDKEAIFKIYVSALTTISLDNHNWISTTDTRLLRRIVRDNKFRNHTAVDTIKMWQSVRRGEDKWIFPFQEEADVMFNSSLIFEFDVLRKHAEPILENVPQNCEEYAEAHRLLRFLKYFRPIVEKSIPPTSLLREFLGGSSFRY